MQLESINREICQLYREQCAYNQNIGVPSFTVYKCIYLDDANFIDQYSVFLHPISLSYLRLRHNSSDRR